MKFSRHSLSTTAVTPSSRDSASSSSPLRNRGTASFFRLTVPVGLEGGNSRGLFHSTARPDELETNEPARRAVKPPARIQPRGPTRGSTLEPMPSAQSGSAASGRWAGEQQCPFLPRPPRARPEQAAHRQQGRDCGHQKVLSPARTPSPPRPRQLALQVRRGRLVRVSCRSERPSSTRIRNRVVNIAG